MNRQKILVGACVLASFSIGANLWLLMRKKEEPPKPAVQQQPEKTAAATPRLPTAAEFDFSGTAFADGSWSLDDGKPEGKNATVFGGTALDDQGWKLDDGKQKNEARPPAGPEGDEAARGIPSPKAKPHAGTQALRTSDPGDMLLADDLWQLADTSDEEPSIAWETPFNFEAFAQRCPVTWELEAYLDYSNRSGPRGYFQRSRRTVDGSYERREGEVLRDTASRGPVFERRFSGGAANLRGWNISEAGPPQIP